MMHSRKIQGGDFHEEEKPCGTHLADPGLANSQVSTKLIKHVIVHDQTSQECCFWWGKSPCGTQHASQGRVIIKSSQT